LKATRRRYAGTHWGRHIAGQALIELNERLLLQDSVASNLEGLAREIVGIHFKKERV
jgi:hypothetical protein